MIETTEHEIFVGNSNELSEIPANSVELVVTSPPYPMIEMWDDMFAELNPAIQTALDAGNGHRAYELMHAELDRTWDEVQRVLIDGGIACINVGDATRKLDDSFRVYQNHSHITEYFDSLGFEPLPDILWRKPNNSGAKFMGSGMLPPNAYVTLEHEYILLFRNGRDSRSFIRGSDIRYESSYFWEERNTWFSDLWEDVAGAGQSLDTDSDDLRDRSAAYPLAIPYRLINMYSVYGDTVLDPFWGTGTTSVAALIAGRNSVGYELNEEFVTVFEEALSDAPELSQEITTERITDHQTFVEDRQESGNQFTYSSNNYDFPVTTKQEKPLQLYTVDSIDSDEQSYTVSYDPYTISEQ